MVVTVNFVKKISRSGRLIAEAFQQIKKMEINCVWITENDCTKVENLEKRVYYVFEEFSGNGFNHLKNLGCKLYGPTCILICSQRSQPLSQVSTPVFCFAMEKVVLSCTNLPKERRLEIYEKVKWMSGVTMAVVDEHITHLVAGEVGSKKYIVANTLKAAVMLPEWVDEVWNSSQTRIVHANDKEFENMKCPMFKGLSVCVSGLEHAERLKIKSLVEMHGGKCSGSLMIKECTHLIIREPKGQKYQAAVKCNIRTVSPQWLDDCLTAGYCIEEDMYLIQPQMKSNDDDDGDGRRTGSKNTSTPTNQSRLVDCNVTTLANISSISVSHVNDTFLSSTTKHNSTIDINMECNNSYTTSKEQDLQNFDKIFSSISSKNFKCNNFLDGCKIYFSGIPTSYMEKMKLISNKGSATRFDDLNDCVSHVVVHDVDHHLIRNLKQISVRPHVVTVGWLVACLMQGQSVPTDAFLHPLDALSPLKNSSPPVKKKLITTTSADCKFTSSTTSNKDICDGDMQAMLSQYLPEDNEFGESTLMKAANGFSVDASGRASTHQDTTRNSNKSCTHQRVHSQESQKNRVEDDGEDTCAVEGDDDVGGEVEEMIFKGLTFAIFEVDDAEGLAKIIRDYGGKVISENACEIADVGVVPMLGCQGACAAREIVTEAWVNICVSDSQLHPYNMLEVFHPLTILPHVTPLNNCVITISGILDIERGIITDVITLLGGIVQDCFVRVAKEPYLACTHLIVNSNEGSKYQAAVKWNVPALHKSWVFECSRTGIKAPEEQFIISKFIVATQQETTETKMKPKGGGGSATDPSPVMQCFSGPTGESARKIVETVSHIHQPGHNASTHNHKNRSTPNSNTKSIAILNRIEINLSKNHIGIGCDAKENDSFADSPLQNCRIKALKEVTMKHASPTSVNKAANDIDTPSKFINNNFQPNFNIQDQSPVPDVRKQLRTSLPLEEVFAENIGLAMNNIASGQSHDESFTQRRQGDDGLEVVQEESKKPLVGVIISVAKKLSKNQAEYNKLAVMLGAQYRWMYTYECTHFVFQGKLNDTNREFRTAREQCKQIVSPFWLVACNEHQSRLDESLYPHTLQHPVPHNMLVGSSKTPNRVPASRVLYPHQSPLNNSFATSNRPSPSSNGMNTPTQPAQHLTTPAAQNPPSHTMREDTQTTELLDGLKKINEASKSVKMNKVKSSVDNQDGSVDNVKSALSRNSSSDDIDVKGSGVKSSKQSGSKPPDKLKDAHTQASQVEVVWDDPFVSRPGSDILPKDGIEPIKLSNEEMNQSAVTETGKNNLRTVEPGKRADLKKIQREYVFNFSGFKDQDKSSLVQIVESLGGSCVDANSSSPCSHLITSTAKRSEKFLVCVSVGKWVLHESYLHACKQSQCFVEEAPYEWGSDEILKLYPDLKPQEFKLARAARRWRLALQGSPSQKEGAFDRWNCLLFINANRVDGFARLLQAGGAQVCANKQPSSLTGITHAFIETKNCPVKVDFKTLVDEGIPCLKFDYIVNFLTDHPPPPFHLFYVQEVELLTRADDNKRKRSRLESPQDVPLKKKQ